MTAILRSLNFRVPKLNLADAIPNLNVKISDVAMPKLEYDTLAKNLRGVYTREGARNVIGNRAMTQAQFDQLLRTKTNIPAASADDAAKAGAKPASDATRNSPDFDPANVKAGSKWSPVKIIAAGAVATAAVIVTGKMLSKAKQGADNDGKTYTITSLSNKDSSGNIDRKSTRLNSSHVSESRMPSSA